MNTNFNSEDNFNELVFENKNKAYGAYAIRKSYNDNVSHSVLLSSMFFGLLVLFAVLITNKKIEIPDMGITNDPVITTTIIDVILKPKAPIVDKVEKPKVPPASTSGQMSASDDLQKNNVKPNDQMVISNLPNLNGSDSTAKDPIIITILPPTKTPPPIVLIPDKMPKLDKMTEFIKENLKYPKVAIDNGTHGPVYLSFVVEIDGTLSDITLKNAIGDGCEQEAKRVVSKMPLWEPGIKDGKPVRVQCTLPINFRLK